MLLNFYLVPKVNRYGEHPLRLSLTIKQKRVMTSIGMPVAKDAWNSRRQLAKEGFVNSRGMTAEEINGRLDEIRTRCREYEKNLIGSPSPAGIRHSLHSEDTCPENAVDRYFRLFIIQAGTASGWSRGTVKSFESLGRHLHNHCGEQTLRYFNDDGVEAFINYLRIDCRMMESTVQKNFKCLKWFLNWCLRKNYIPQNQTFSLKPKIKNVRQPVIFLTKEELLRLFSYTIPQGGTVLTLKTYSGEKYQMKVADSKYLELSRDLFCFCAFTSLRYSDMIKLKQSDIFQETLFITTAKTNDRIPINLNKYSMSIINKYLSRRTDDYLFPRISNAKMNIYIKKICEMCGINSPVSKVYFKGGVRIDETVPKFNLIGTHAGRRTFICFALACGIPPQVIMKWTGHSDYKSMRPYIEIADRTKTEQMAIFERKLDE